MSDQQKHRANLTRKSDAEEAEPEGKPTLGKRVSKMTSRQERIVEALNRLDDAKLQSLTTKMGPDELAVALVDADDPIKDRLASFLPPEGLEMFNEYRRLGRAQLPGDVIDGVQGKLLRLF